MIKFLRFFIKRPVAVITAALLIAAGAVFALFAVKDPTLPVSRESTLIVRLSCPQETAEGVRQSVSDPAEAILSSIKGVRGAAAVSSPKKAAVYLSLEPDAEITAVKTEIISRLDLNRLGAVLSGIVSGDAAALEIVCTSPQGEGALKAGARSLEGDLMRLSGAAAVRDFGLSEGEVCYRNGMRAVRLEIIAEKDADIAALKEAAAKLSSNAAAYGITAETVYDFSAGVKSVTLTAALCLTIGGALSVAVLLLLLRSVRAALAGAAALIVNLLFAAAVTAATGLFSAASLPGLSAGLICSSLTAYGTAAAIIKRTDRGENAYSAAAAGATAAARNAVLCAAVFLCLLLPSAFIPYSASFALPAIAAALFSLPCCLILLPCLLCLIKGGAKYYLAGDPLKKEVARPAETQPSNREVTAQPLTAAEEKAESAKREAAGRSFDDFVLPSLSDISRLNKRARRAVRRSVHAADRPMRAIGRGWTAALGAVLKHRTAAAALALLLFACSLPLLFACGVELSPPVYAPRLGVTMRFQDAAGAEAAALKAAGRLTALRDAEGCTVEVKDNVAVIRVNLKSAGRAERAAAQAAAALKGYDAETTVSLSDQTQYPSRGESTVSVRLFATRHSDLKEMAQEIKAELSNIKGLFSVSEGLGAHDLASSEGRYMLQLDVCATGTDTGSAVSALLLAAGRAAASREGCFYRAAGIQPAVSFAAMDLAGCMAVALLLLYFIAAAATGGALRPLAALATLALTISGSMIALAVTGTALGVGAVLGMAVAAAVVLTSSLNILRAVTAAAAKTENKQAAAATAAVSQLKYALAALLCCAAALLPVAFSGLAPAAPSYPLGIAALGGTLLGGLTATAVVPLLLCLFGRWPQPQSDEELVYDLSESGIEIEITPPPAQSGSGENPAENGEQGAARPPAPLTDLPPPPDKILL